jgi:hypothetical protein
MAGCRALQLPIAEHARATTRASLESGTIDATQVIETRACTDST